MFYYIIVVVKTTKTYSFGIKSDKRFLSKEDAINACLEQNRLEDVKDADDLYDYYEITEYEYSTMR